MYIVYLYVVSLKECFYFNVALYVMSSVSFFFADFSFLFSLQIFIAADVYFVCAPCYMALRDVVFSTAKSIHPIYICMYINFVQNIKAILLGYGCRVVVLNVYIQK